jgi:hypothetical protein
MLTFSADISGVYKVRLGATPAVVDVGGLDAGDGVVGDGGLDVGDGGTTDVGDGAFDVKAGADVESGEVIAVVVGGVLVVDGGVDAFFPAHPDIDTAAASNTTRTRTPDALLNAIIVFPPYR